MAFRLNRTLNRKAPLTLDQAVRISPILQELHKRNLGKPTTLKESYQENNSFMLSANLAKLGLGTIGVGSLIVAAVFYTSFQKDADLTLKRKSTNTDRQHQEGRILLSKKLDQEQKR